MSMVRVSLIDKPGWEYRTQLTTLLGASLSVWNNHHIPPKGNPGTWWEWSHDPRSAPAVSLMTFLHLLLQSFCEIIGNIYIGLHP